MTYHSDTLAFKKVEILKVMQSIDPNFDLGSAKKIEANQLIESNQQFDEVTFKPPYDYTFYLFKKPLLTFREASCIMTGYNPQYVEQCQNDENFEQVFADYLGAMDYIDSCIGAQMICYNSMDNRIYAEDFKKFLANDGAFIDGFNDYLKNDLTNHNLDNQNSIIDQLKKQNEQLKAELLEKDQKIKELEQLNLNADSDLPDLSVGQLTGLAKRNQLAQDRQGMARIIALSFWEKDQNILIGDMADRVYRTMIDYCKDDLPQLTDTLKSWIRPVATEEAQKKGRPKSSI